MKNDFFQKKVSTLHKSVTKGMHEIKLTAFMLHIRIYHECEGKEKKSVPRIAVWDHEACRVMTSGDPEGLIFLYYPHTNNRLFFLLTTVFFIFK